ncbi:DnaJ C-terminal domain-containing protein [Bacteroidota bacterium]
MDYKDYYKVLGVNKSASQDEIKKAYRKLAKQHHPDKNKGDKASEEKFKEISEAYQVVGNEESRKKYDEMGSNWKQYEQSGAYSGQGSQYRKGQNHQYSSADYEDLFGGSGGFSDFFESYFGGAYQSGRSQKREWSVPGEDYQAKLNIDLLQAYQGTSTVIQLDGGKLKVNIRPGVKNGQLLRLKGKGAKGSGGAQSGHLYIKVEIKTDPDFERKGDDLYTTVDVDLYKAVLGGKQTVKTLGGNLNINLPKDSQNGKVVRLKNKGMPHYNKAEKFGDLYVKINIILPQNLSDKETELFEELRNIREK